MVDLIELCAGTGAVTLAACGVRFPVSRIGSKAGWSEPILKALGCVPPITSAVLVEADPRLARLLGALFSMKTRKVMADKIEATLTEPAREVWEQARSGEGATNTLLWLAGARGGIGGFKGAHKLRPSVDGFIPSRASLARRVRAFTVDCEVEILCEDASDVEPSRFEPGAVYIDPPYQGRQGYRHSLREPVEELAKRWASAGHRVVVSEARPLPGASGSREITSLRRGQSRRSLTTDHVEWLSFYGC